MSKKEERLAKLIDLLKSYERFDYVKEGWERATIYRDIKEIKAKYNLDDSAIKTKNTEVFFNKENKNFLQDDNRYLDITPEIINKYKIMYFLQNVSNDTNKLYKSNETYNLGILLPGKTTIDNTIKSLKEDSEVLCDKEKSLQVQNGNIPITWGLSYDELCNIYDLLQYAKGSALEDAYKMIGEDCQELLSIGDDSFSPLDVYYESYGRTLQTAENLKKNLEDLKRINYRQYAIRFQEHKNEGKKIVVNVALVFYSVEKDQLYILGKPNKKSIEYICHPVSKLYNIEQLEDPNEFYGDADFVEIYNQIYGVASNETLYDVELEIENTSDIRGKLKCLEQNRKYGKIEKKDSKLIYTDKVRGLSSFSRLVRSYGSACKVIQPEELKNIISNGANNALKNYEGESSNE